MKSSISRSLIKNASYQARRKCSRGNVESNLRLLFNKRKKKKKKKIKTKKFFILFFIKKLKREYKTFKTLKF